MFQLLKVTNKGHYFQSTAGWYCAFLIWITPGGQGFSNMLEHETNAQGLLCISYFP